MRKIAVTIAVTGAIVVVVFAVAVVAGIMMHRCRVWNLRRRRPRVNVLYCTPTSLRWTSADSVLFTDVVQVSLLLDLLLETFN